MSAIAMVFSFFSLNPSPFCILAEIDAPLGHDSFLLPVKRYKDIFSAYTKRIAQEISK